MKESGWMTIPEWNSVEQTDLFCREQELQAVPGADAPENLHVLVRGTIELLPAQEYDILVAADDHYQIWIDGVYRGQGPAASLPECCFYDCYPLGSLPGAGETGEPHAEKRKVTVALHLYYHGRISRSWTSGDGRFGLWLSVREKNHLPGAKMPEEGVSKEALRKGFPAEEPGKEVAHCDESWRYQICSAYSGETAGYDTQFLENFDSRLWPEGWELPDFHGDLGTETDGFADEREENGKYGGTGETGWGHLVPALWADYRMLPRPIRMLEERDAFPVRRWEERTERKASFEQETVRMGLPADDGGSTGFCRVVLDFGREITGAVVAEAAGPAGAQVVLRCGEELDEYVGGAIISDERKEKICIDADTKTEAGAVPRVRQNMRCGCTYEEIWTLGEGVSRLHPYDYKGFRYAELLYPETVELRQVYARVRHYPMAEDACTLKCSWEVLERIFEICKNAVRCCSQDGYLDCPTREKGQYLGDALITARSQVWLTGSTGLLRKCIWDFISSGTISPSLMAVAPGSVMQEIADFSLLFPLLPLTDYAFTGDQTYLARCYPAVRTLTESFLIYRREDGLLENVSALWNLVDWPENLRDGYDFPLTRPVVGKGCHNVVNALWYGANFMQEKIEELLGLPSTGRSPQIADSFRRVFYRGKQRLFADSESSEHCSVHANLYAAFFGLLPKESEEAYVRLLQTPGRVCGVLPAYFALKSLARMGRPEVCFEQMTRPDAYGWRNMIREGASASFEVWGKDQKWNTSLCHGWSSGFLPLFIEEIAGLHPDPGMPEGYRFEPPRIADCPDFELNVPWRGNTIRIIKKNPDSRATMAGVAEYRDESKADRSERTIMIM